MRKNPLNFRWSYGGTFAEESEGKGVLMNGALLNSA